MCLAIPGRVLSIEEQDGTRMGMVDFSGVRKEVCLAYVPDLQVGDYTIVHVGFALSKIDEAAAQETLHVLSQMGVLEEELDQLRDTENSTEQGSASGKTEGPPAKPGGTVP
jgi:hydrogenase expression/formation protein HypC